jgi:hypothetical protein
MNVNVNEARRRPERARSEFRTCGAEPSQQHGVRVRIPRAVPTLWRRVSALARPYLLARHDGEHRPRTGHLLYRHLRLLRRRS